MMGMKHIAAFAILLGRSITHQNNVVPKQIGQSKKAVLGQNRQIMDKTRKGLFSPESEPIYTLFWSLNFINTTNRQRCLS